MSAFYCPEPLSAFPRGRLVAGVALKFSNPPAGEGAPACGLSIPVCRTVRRGFGPGSRPAFIPEVAINYWFPATGNRNVTTGAFNAVGNNGNYWSDTPNSAANGYDLNFNAGNVNPGNNNNRGNGFAARCVSEF